MLLLIQLMPQNHQFAYVKVAMIIAKKANTIPPLNIFFIFAFLLYNVCIELLLKKLLYKTQQLKLKGK